MFGILQSLFLLFKYGNPFLFSLALFLPHFHRDDIREFMHFVLEFLDFQVLKRDFVIKPEHYLVNFEDVSVPFLFKVADKKQIAFMLLLILFDRADQLVLLSEECAGNQL